MFLDGKRPKKNAQNYSKQFRHKRQNSVPSSYFSALSWYPIQPALIVLSCILHGLPRSCILCLTFKVSFSSIPHAFSQQFPVRRGLCCAFPRTLHRGTYRTSQELHRSLPRAFPPVSPSFQTFVYSFSHSSYVRFPLNFLERSSGIP